MPNDKPRPSLADYITIAFSPALIMAMIVSLVFFLLAVLYRGEFVSRLHSILFFFIFGMVLVARIAMETSHSGRAPLYGGVLALLAWVGMGNFVNYPPELASSSWLINAGLIGIAWWLSYQLTHSCTYIDEKAESTGRGVLHAAGLETSAAGEASSADSDAREEPSDKKRSRKLTWWQRYQRFREERKRTQPPGVWVVYFALAALPIFGLGQALIDVSDSERRKWTFWLMALYASSALGLLVTTSFLGLRRYLRQRRLEMPAKVTVAWLTVGAGLVFAFVTIGAALPRPQSEYSPFTIARADSKKVAASKYALTRGEPGKGPGKPGKRENDDKADTKADGNRQGQGKQGKNNAKTQKDSDKGGADKKSDPKQNAEQKKSDSQSDEKAESDNKDADASNDLQKKSWFPAFLTDLAKLLKWIVFGALILLTAFLVLTGGLRYLANFCEWARQLLEALHRFWENLFGGRRAAAASVGEAEEATTEYRKPFSAFPNPFLDGCAETMAPAQLVGYSFEALEAWAHERDWARGSEETPIEFTARIAGEAGNLDKETVYLGTLYARVLYARGALPMDWRDTVKSFWTQIDAAGAHRKTVPNLS